METLVRMGELAISDTPGDVLVSLGLGSCIGLAVVDKRAGVAGLAHIVLPAATGAPKPESLNKFADHVVPALVDGMVQRGASRVFMQAALVGGASMFAAAGLEVGQRNAEAVRELVAGRRVPVVAEAVGGSRGRTVKVNVASGTVSVREAGGVEEVLAA
jgi:chemotaxis protein CheD